MAEKPDVQNTGGKNISGKTAEPNPIPVPNSGTPVKMIDPGTLKFWESPENGGDDFLPENLGTGVKSDQKLTTRHRPVALCLSVCRECNLACRYCYVKNRPEMESSPPHGFGDSNASNKLV